MNEQRLISVEQFAKMADLNKYKVYELIRWRKIPYIKVGEFGSRRARVLSDPDEAIAALRKEYFVPARGRFFLLVSDYNINKRCYGVTTMVVKR